MAPKRIQSSCCIRPYYCVECDKRRADREISRLREVLRTTMDQFLDTKEEVKDLRAKYKQYEKGLFDLQDRAKVGKEKANKAFKALYELQLSVALAKRGKISVADIKIPPEDEIHYEFTSEAVLGPGRADPAK